MLPLSLLLLALFLRPLGNNVEWSPDTGNAKQKKAHSHTHTDKKNKRNLFLLFGHLFGLLWAFVLIAALVWRVFWPPVCVCGLTTLHRLCIAFRL